MSKRLLRLLCLTPWALSFLSRAASAEAPARADSLREQSSLTGGTGLLHLQDPLAGAAQTFRVSLLFDTYRGSGFLCNAATPCPNVDEDSASHFGTTFNISATPVAFLEAYASLESYANSNDARIPSVTTAVGNTTFGLKAFTPDPLAKWFRFGGAMEVGFLSNSGSVGVAGAGTSFRALALGQADFRGPDQRGVPLRARLNVGYLLDNSAQTVESVEQARGAPITRIERFGLDINRVDQFQLGLGVDGLFGVARPFVEWNLGVPVNRQGYACFPDRSFSGDGCLATDAKLSAFPSKLTLGSRFFPWLPGLGVTAAIDIGTSGTSNFIEELSPTLPWDLSLGVSYGFDVVPPKPVVVTKEVEKVVAAPQPVELRVRGLVHEQEKQQGIAKALVTFDGRDLTGMVTTADGHFTSANLQPGTYTLTVEASGYKPGQFPVTIPQNAPESSASPPVSPHYVDVDCELVPVPPLGVIDGHVRDVVGMTAVSAVNATLRDRLGRELSLTTDAGGSFHVDSIVPGPMTLSVDAEGYLFHSETVEVPPRAEVRLEIGLRRRPKPGQVKITPKELVFTQPIRFDADATQPSADSLGVLEEIADALHRSPEPARLEVRVYTDASGDPARDQTLTDQRAQAVRDWLLAHGVDSSRLTARGFGSTHPVSPNVTAAGRARNRRVKLMAEGAP